MTTKLKEVVSSAWMLLWFNSLLKDWEGTRTHTMGQTTWSVPMRGRDKRRFRQDKQGNNLWQCLHPNGDWVEIFRKDGTNYLDGKHYLLFVNGQFKGRIEHSQFFYEWLGYAE